MDRKYSNNIIISIKFSNIQRMPEINNIKKMYTRTHIRTQNEISIFFQIIKLSFILPFP